MNKKTKGNKSENTSTRREFIKKATTSTTAIIISPVLFASCEILSNSSARILEKEDLFDEALQMMSHIAPLGNHGPMAAEALVELGEIGRLPNFINQFLKEFSAKFPDKKQDIEENNWKELIGKNELITDWIMFFEKAINENDWKSVVNKWAKRLAPGLSAAATHGLIRTGHSVRSLTLKETDVRKKELAQALGYWASQYQQIPIATDNKNLKLDLTEAIKRIPILPKNKMIQKGNIMLELRNLNDFEEFAEVTNLIEIKGDAEKLISNLTESFSKVYLERVNRRNLIRLIHVITSLASIRTLLPIISDQTKEKLLFYGWQASAGLISICDQVKNSAFDSNQKINQHDLIRKAVGSNEVHAIKFTEACLREYKINPKSSYLLAAKDAVERLT